MQRLDFGLDSGSKSARMAKLLQFSQDHPKPAFSEKVQRGDQKDAIAEKGQKHCGANGIVL